MINEKAPPGWSGTTTAMKVHHSDEIDNPWALSWWMKNRGDKPHYKKTKDNKSTGKKVPKNKKDEGTLPTFSEWLEEKHPDFHEGRIGKHLGSVIGALTGAGVPTAMSCLAASRGDWHGTLDAIKSAPGMTKGSAQIGRRKGDEIGDKIGNMLGMKKPKKTGFLASEWLEQYPDATVAQPGLIRRTLNNLGRRQPQQNTNDANVTMGKPQSGLFKTIIDWYKYNRGNWSDVMKVASQNRQLSNFLGIAEQATEQQQNVHPTFEFEGKTFNGMGQIGDFIEQEVSKSIPKHSNRPSNYVPPWMQQMQRMQRTHRQTAAGGTRERENYT